jgi:hemolysin activation/secretion protein
LNGLATYHLSVAGPVETDLRLHGAVASDDTPLFELPSLGGEDTTRGFRGDQVFGQHLWSAQSELWLPLPVAPSSSTFLANLVRNLRIAGFYDVGGIDALPGSPGGLRQGAGVGLRLRYQGVVFALDVAHGFGADALDPGNRLYFNVRLP